MTRRRWIADEVEGSRAWLTGEHAHHLAHVLRAQVGQEFDVTTPAGVFRGSITSVQEQRVEFALGELVPAVAAPDVTLVLAIFKFDRMEWALEKAAELGVTRILPAIAARSEKHLCAAAGKRVERWRRLLRQAAEQSRRAVPPEIATPAPLETMLARTASTKLVLAEFGASLQLRETLATHSAQPLVLAIGPEGGWTNQEVQQFSRAGWTLVTLGPNILRAETAAIAALAVVMSALQ
jgi:16S rRNA (uracil1498-N3)-methyltransferase